MAASAKSLSLVKELKDRLARRTTLAISDFSYDSDGGAYFLIGSATAGQQGMLVKSKQIDPIGFDGIGNAARGYSQTVLQMVVETSSIANVSLLTAANLLPLFGEILRQASRVELYMSANGTGVGIAQITGANLKSTWEADLQYRLMDSQ